MSTARRLTLSGVFVALLIAAQWAFSFVAGVEIVTPLLLVFCYCFGVKTGMLTATAFSLLRCVLFGFFPNVILLYLIYYNLFALFFGWIGNRARKKYGVKIHLLLVLLAAAFACIFTLLDDVITPLCLGWNLGAAKAYFVASLPVMLTQAIAAAVTVGALFFPLYKGLKLAVKDGKIEKIDEK